MRALATTLALVASSAAAALGVADPADARVPSAAAPGGVAAAPDAPSAPPTSTLPAKRPAVAPVVPTRALLDKLGQGDRMFQSGDYRSALFAYQDAVYMQPTYAPARVRLGRAYLALRYPAQAAAQAEAALAEAPDSAEAKKLLEEAQNLPTTPPAGLASPAPADGATSPRATPRVYKLTPEPDPQSASSAALVAAPIRAAGAGTPAATALPPAERMAIAPTGGVAAIASPDAAPPVRAPAPIADVAPASAPAVTPEQARAAAEHYRTAIGFLKSRDWEKAVAELSEAITADPRLAVAWSARGSARFGLGAYREAAEDYRGAMALDASLATPLYGLAECYRALGDRKNAAAMYERYAVSGAPDVRDDLRAIAAKRAAEPR